MKTGKRLWMVVLMILVGSAAAVVFKQSQGASGPFWSLRGKTSSAIYYCPMHPTYTSDRPGNCPICNMKLVKREGNPAQEMQSMTGHAGHEGPKEFTVQELMKMKPGEICLLHKCKMGRCLVVMTKEVARSGKCPHCGEDLGVIVKDLAPTGYGAVQLTPEKQRMIGIKTEMAKKMPMTKTIRATGRIAYDPELYQAQEEFIQAARAGQKAAGGTIDEIKDQASGLVESSKIKLRLLGLSDDLIAEIEKAGKPDRSLLYSEPGGTVWLYASIYEYEIPLVKVGAGIEVEAPAIADKKIHGVVRSIDSRLDPVTRSVRVRAVLENPEGILKPEMYVNATLQIDLGEVLAVPEEAVLVTGEENIVFVAKSTGYFEPRHVTLGAKSEQFQEIRSGISEGETVVVSGNFLVDSESRLKAALEGISGGTHQHGS